MKIKTADLTGAALDWAVCKAEGDELAARNIEYPKQAKHFPTISPSTDWSQGGPIIERELISVEFILEWYADMHGEHGMDGPTPLIAAMRCFCCSKLGDEIEIPDELLGN